MRTSAILLASLLTLTSATTSRAEDPSRTWNRLVALLQYLGSDYPLAVESRSQFELDEQVSLTAEVLGTADKLGPKGAPFLPKLRSLQARVAKHEDPLGVQRDCRALINALVVAGGLKNRPRHPPNLGLGEHMFMMNCTQCHGADGRGQVEIAETMQPRPADLSSPERLQTLTPFRVFNAVGFGVHNTAMPAFEFFSEAEQWAVAFHVLTLHKPRCEGAPPRATLEKLALKTDLEVSREYGTKNLACLRRSVSHAVASEAVRLARADVQQALKHARAAKPEDAKAALLDAYLLAFEPVEPMLLPRNPEIVSKVEKAFAATRLAMDGKREQFEKEGQLLLYWLQQAGEEVKR